jgi:hypothetical protein
MNMNNEEIVNINFRMKLLDLCHGCLINCTFELKILLLFD